MDKENNTRNIRLAGVLQPLISKILEKEGYNQDGTIITVTEVDINRALTLAKVFLSIFPENKAKKIFDSIVKDIYQIQQQVNKQCQIKIVPKIIFKLDERVAKADEVEKLFLIDQKRISNIEE